MKVWVVEVKDNGRWKPCASVSLTRAEALREMRDYWKVNCPNDKFRVSKYVSLDVVGKAVSDTAANFIG